MESNLDDISLRESSKKLSDVSGENTEFGKESFPIAYQTNFSSTNMNDDSSQTEENSECDTDEDFVFVDTEKSNSESDDDEIMISSEVSSADAKPLFSSPSTSINPKPIFNSIRLNQQRQKQLDKKKKALQRREVWNEVLNCISRSPRNTGFLNSIDSSPITPKNNEKDDKIFQMKPLSTKENESCKNSTVQRKVFQEEDDIYCYDSENFHNSSLDDSNDDTDNDKFSETCQSPGRKRRNSSFDEVTMPETSPSTIDNNATKSSLRPIPRNVLKLMHSVTDLYENGRDYTKTGIDAFHDIISVEPVSKMLSYVSKTAKTVSDNSKVITDKTITLWQTITFNYKVEREKKREDDRNAVLTRQLEREINLIEEEKESRQRSYESQLLQGQNESVDSDVNVIRNENTPEISVIHQDQHTPYKTLQLDQECSLSTPKTSGRRSSAANWVDNYDDFR